MILVTKNLRKGSITKSLPWGTRIGIQIEIPKVVTIIFRGLGILTVKRNICVSILAERNVTTQIES